MCLQPFLGLVSISRNLLLLLSRLFVGIFAKAIGVGDPRGTNDFEIIHMHCAFTMKLGSMNDVNGGELVKHQ